MVDLNLKMKYSEFHRLIERNGWKFSHAKGSHYFYVKDGKLNHGAKEIYEPLRRAIARQMELK